MRGFPSARLLSAPSLCLAFPTISMVVAVASQIHPAHDQYFRPNPALDPVPLMVKRGEWLEIVARYSSDSVVMQFEVRRPKEKKKKSKKGKTPQES